MPVRKILKDTCILAALMILAVFTLSIIWSGVTAEISLVLALVSYIIKYFVFSGIVMLFGFIVGWFFPSNFWMAFVYVGVVLALAFAIDAFTVRRDIGYINEHIRRGNE